MSFEVPVVSALATFSDDAMGLSMPRPVLIVCSRVFREGLKHLLHSTSVTCTEGSATVAEAVAQMEAGDVPDLVIAVASTEETNNDAFLSVRIARARFPQTRWLLLTDKVTPERLRKAAAAGIDGLLPHEISGRVLVHAVELLLLGQPLLPSALAWAVPGTHVETRRTATEPAMLSLTPREPLVARYPPNRNPCHLSKRERQILDGLAKGQTNKLIAKQLAIADTTVKVHVKALLRKLQVANRTQAAILALTLDAPEAASGEVVDLAGPSRVITDEQNEIGAGFSKTTSERTVA